jgi:hypothetical protein
LSRSGHRLYGIGTRLLSLFLFSTMLSQANTQKVTFPGRRSEAKSPDGRYAIRNADDEKKEPAHTLTLIDSGSGSSTQIYSYGRHVDVLWSPTSRAFVVNDYEGSDTSRPVLFTVPWAGQPLDLREKLTYFLRSRGKAKGVDGNHHVYFTVQHWLSGDEILCQVTGYGDADPKGFTERYIYKLGGDFRAHQ